MKRLTVATTILLMLLFVLPALAQYGFRVSVTTNAKGQCDNWITILEADIVYELVEGTADKVVYADADVPDENVISNSDSQEWLIRTENDNGWYGISFSVSEVGITTKVYWLSYTKDATNGYWSRAQGRIIESPDAPIPK